MTIGNFMISVSIIDVLRKQNEQWSVFDINLFYLFSILFLLGGGGINPNNYYYEN